LKIPLTSESAAINCAAPKTTTTRVDTVFLIFVLHFRFLALLIFFENLRAFFYVAP
jgi:hypothetical protein